MGSAPASAQDWKLAAMLDPHTYQSKNQGVRSVIEVARITPHPGLGTVRAGLFIPAAQVTDTGPNDYGDNRGPDPQFDPEQTRASVYVDYEHGLVIIRQNPSVTVDGQVRVGQPDLDVMQRPDGEVKLNYNAVNPFAPDLASVAWAVRGETIITPPSDSSSGWQLDAKVGNYPSLEMYHDAPDGATGTIYQYNATMDPDGALDNLPWAHTIGNVDDAERPFHDWTSINGSPPVGPQEPGGPYVDQYVPTRAGDPNHPPVAITVP